MKGSEGGGGGGAGGGWVGVWGDETEGIRKGRLECDPCLALGPVVFSLARLSHLETAIASGLRLERADGCQEEEEISFASFHFSS